MTASATDWVSGRIYCFGGHEAVLGNTDQILQYDPASDTLVVQSAILPSPRDYCVADANPSSGRIYCFGGNDRSGYLDEIVELDPAAPPRAAAMQIGDAGDGSGAIANTWRVFSSRDFKQGISPLQQQDYDGILDKLNSTDVVRYRYRQDRQNTQHLGVIAEDSPAEILGPDRKSVSLADYIAFLHAATKAQQQLIEDRNCRIAELESRLDELESTVSRLAENAKEDER